MDYQKDNTQACEPKPMEPKPKSERLSNAIYEISCIQDRLDNLLRKIRNQDKAEVPCESREETMGSLGGVLENGPDEISERVNEAISRISDIEDLLF